jgi:hypothetical protein
VEPVVTAKTKTPAAGEAASQKKSAVDSPSAGMSVADILAAARSKTEATKKAPPSAPAAKSDAPPEAKKPAPAAQQGMSVADILAAARGKAGAPGKPTAKPVREATSKAAPVPATEKKDLSVAEILAAARGKSTSAATPPSVAAKPEPTAAAVEKPAPPKKAAARREATPKPGLPADVPGIVAFCRKTDAKK